MGWHCGTFEGGEEVAQFFLNGFGVPVRIASDEGVAFWGKVLSGGED